LRGYLLHRDRLGLLQSITFRLADSLPQAKLKQLEEELSSWPEEKRDGQRRVRIEEWLDAGMGCCALGHPDLAREVRNARLHFDGQRYRLPAWGLMPNHGHVLIEPLVLVVPMVQGWKSVKARWALLRNDSLGLGIPDPHRLWMGEYWDRYIRDERHFLRVIVYIHENPVKAGLCRGAGDWAWSRTGGADSGNVDAQGCSRY